MLIRAWCCVCNMRSCVSYDAASSTPSSMLMPQRRRHKGTGAHVKGTQACTLSAWHVTSGGMAADWAHLRSGLAEVHGVVGLLRACIAGSRC